MAEIRVLVLGNNTFAENLDKALNKEGIVHVVDREIVPSTTYDICFSQPNRKLLDKIRSKSQFCRTVVFNGVEISNADLRYMVQLHISSFLDDHEDPTAAIEMIRQILQSKEKLESLAYKVNKLCLSYPSNLNSVPTPSESVVSVV